MSRPESGHIDGAVKIPLTFFHIMYMMVLSEVDKSSDIIVYRRAIGRHYDEQGA